MGKSAALDNGLLLLIFNAVNLSLLADNTVTTPLTSLYVSLHTADPTAAGNQVTNETAYTGYTRIAVARTSAGWTVAGNSVSPAAAITFPACTGSPGGAITYAAVGELSTGAGKILYSGVLTPAITMAVGVTPQMTTSTTITET